jgi:anthranilate/para-aminobenzoate synthase component I
MQIHPAPPADLLRIRIARPCDPLDLSVRLAVAGLVDEYLIYEQDGRWSFAGGVLGSVTVDQSTVRTEWNAGDEDRVERVTALGDTHPVHALGAAMRALPTNEWRAYGWVAFESALAAGRRPAQDADQTLAYLFVPRLEVTIDRAGAEVRCADPELLDRAAGVLNSAGPAGSAHPVRPLDVEAEGPEAYQAAVASAVRRIRRGELEKVILSRAVEVPFALDFPATYLAGRRANTPARYAHGGDDLRSRAELTTDPKEVYEHAVSVKLADTELRTVCAAGTVGVAEFMTLKERGSVRHLGSRLHGQLSADRTPWDALAALFPAVTASGIPKAEAYSVIAELEHEPRGLYSGAIVRADSAGELDAALALRTVYTRRGRTYLRAGAGIVAASLPAREYQETCEKLASVAPYLVPLAD